MEIGVGSYAYRWSIGIHDYKPERPLTPVELLERVAALGAKVIQYADNMPLHTYDAEVVREIGHAAEEYSIRIELGTHGVDPENLRTYLDLASELRAGVVRVTPRREDFALPRDKLLERLAEAGDAYEKAGSTLALENHFLLPSRDLADLVARLNHPAVGVCLDVANSIVNGEWPEETVERLAPYAVNLHIKDYQIEIDPYGVGMHVVGTPIGEGRTDVAWVLRVLREADRDVNAIVEHWLPKERYEAVGGGLELEDAWTRRSIEAVYACLKTPAGSGEVRE